MNRMTMVFSVFMVLLLSNSLLLGSYRQFTKAQGGSSGLSWNYYDSQCPKLESIVRKRLKKVFKNDIGQAAGLLRLHFHDCFVQGCDGSLLLDGSASNPSEKSAPPNLTLKPQAFKIINDLQRRVHEECGRVVSCADIVTLTARDSVFLTGGPYYDLPLGRRDSLTFGTLADVLANLPAPSATTTLLLTTLGTKNFTATDVVALSGSHTIGVGTCLSFTRRLYPTQDPIMDETFATYLKAICPTKNSNNSAAMDIRSPKVFDNKYYLDLMNRQGLFSSDQDLYTDSRTRPIVTSFAINQTMFFEKFVSSMIRMSQLSVLTGSQGEIRENCSARNSESVLVSTEIGEEKEGWSAS